MSKLRVPLYLLMAVVLLGGLWPSLGTAQSVANSAKPAKIIIANDTSYPPGVFIDADGQPRGMNIDLWKLWSKKTGVAVEFKLMEWDAALASVREGKADVVGGLFRTPQREAYFDFTAAYETVITSIFFHQDIRGVKQLVDLTGFRVGVVKGDSCEEFIRQKYPKIELQTYPGADDLVVAAVAGEIKAFVSDSNVARFYLAKHDLANRFREATPPLTENELLAAVKKGDQQLLALVQGGLDQITEQV